MGPTGSQRIRSRVPGVHSLGIAGQDPAYQARRRSLRAFLRGVGRITGSRRRPDGDPCQYRAARAGRPADGQGRRGVPVVQVPRRPADRRGDRRLARDAIRRPDHRGDRHAHRRVRVLPDFRVAGRRVGGRTQLRLLHSSPPRHGPGSRRYRPGSGDRSTVFSRSTRGARCAARHRVGTRGGGPHDRNAHRHGRPRRLGHSPLLSELRCAGRKGTQADRKAESP
ncbi:Uncharacterised protein [Mycobacteroides abscessus subsp. abscessus]|nr:Uncharacterised protein [Mycobacteroides abscessus subsp. abscessus]